MQKLAEKNVGRVLDLLNERLTFERAGVKLYDAILERMRASGDSQIQQMIEQMQEHREDEKRHEEWLEEQIRALGGDAHTPSEKSILVQAESQGIEHVVQRDPRLPHDFHALLVAELADNAGWDLLVKLAAEAHDGEAKRAFRKRLYEEVDHLAYIRKALGRYERREVLGQMVSMPRSVLL
jgi:rubrerythrin